MGTHRRWGRLRPEVLMVASTGVATFIAGVAGLLQSNLYVAVPTLAAAALLGSWTVYHQLRMPLSAVADDAAEAAVDHAGRRGGLPAGRERVFFSHTPELASWPQSRSCVQAALDAIRSAGHVGVDMRDFAAQDRPPAEVCRRAVRGCEAYVAVIGFRYGSLVPGRDVSYTELEFDMATDAGIPRVVVVLRSPPDDASLVDADRTRIDRFRHRLVGGSRLTATTVDSADQVEFAVYRALVQLRAEPRGAMPASLLAGWVWAGPDGAEGVRGHVQRRGFGQRSQARGGDLFRGRAAALAAVTGWLQAQDPPGRVLVVTGQPGGGQVGGGGPRRA